MKGQGYTRTGTDEFEQPRAALKAAPAKDFKKLHSEILGRLRQPTDYMSHCK